MRYLLARLKEASTWSALGAGLGVMATQITAWSTPLYLAAGLAGAAAFLIKDGPS